jgi:hypothetical protein
MADGGKVGRHIDSNLKVRIIVRAFFMSFCPTSLPGIFVCMITDEMIKKEFISEVVSRDIKLIYATQEQVVREVFPNGTGALAGFLAKSPFDMSGAGLRRTFFMRIFPYLRFLDIRYRRDQMATRRKLALYNRVIYGVLYHETMPALRYGLTEELREKIGQQLRAANPGA